MLSGDLTGAAALLLGAPALAVPSGLASAALVSAAALLLLFADGG